MKQKPRDKERLEHILEAANNIQEFSNEVTFDEFLQNKMLQYAIVKNFEIIGEAAYHLSKEIRDNRRTRLNGAKSWPSGIY